MEPQSSQNGEPRGVALFCCVVVDHLTDTACPQDTIDAREHRGRVHVTRMRMADKGGLGPWPKITAATLDQGQFVVPGVPASSAVAIVATTIAPQSLSPTSSTGSARGHCAARDELLCC